MDEKRRSKRKSMDDGYWDCSVCTYRNTPEAFKCEMCDVRKGTSTRKPRLNPQLVAQQVAQQFPAPAKKEKSLHRRDKDGREKDVRERDIEKDEIDSLEQDDSMDTDIQDHSSSWSADGDTMDILAPEPKPESKPADREEKTESVTPESLPPQPSQPKKEIKEKKTSNASTSHSGTSVKKHRTPRLKNIDRSSGTSMEVTVGNVTVIITDYKPKKDKHSTSSSAAQVKDTSSPQQGSQLNESGPSHIQQSPNSTNSATWANRSEKVETNGHIELDNKNR